MGFFSALAKGIAVGGVKSAANYQLQQRSEQEPKKKKRNGCDTCAAMAEVDAARRRMNFSTK